MLEPGQLLRCSIELCPGHAPVPGDMLMVLSITHVQHASCFGTWDVTFAAGTELMLFEFDDRHVGDIDCQGGFLARIC